MPFEPFTLIKVVAASLGKIVKTLSSTHTDIQKMRAGDQAALEKTIARGIENYPERSALGGYLRDLRVREVIRSVKGLHLSPKELPAFFAYMAENRASEQDLLLAWPHRALTSESTFDFVLNPLDQVQWWTCLVQAMLYLVCATLAFALARFTPPRELLQILKFVGLAFFLMGCSALPMYACRSIRAVKRIRYRRGRER